MSNKAYSKEWKIKNRERFKEIQKRSLYKTRLKVLQHYSGKEVPDCKCCGETIFEFLQIDHINGNGADHRREIGMAQGDINQVAKQKEKGKISLGGNGFIYWIIRNNYPKGFQILCANCNAGKRTSRYCPHEVIKGLDLNGNKISVKRLDFPEPTRRRNGEAKREADELGINVDTLRMRRWKAKNPKPKVVKEISTHCKNGHAYADGNLYQWKGHRQCRQCKRDYKARIKLGE